MAAFGHHSVPPSLPRPVRHCALGLYTLRKSLQEGRKFRSFVAYIPLSDIVVRIFAGYHALNNYFINKWPTREEFIPL